MTWVAAAVTVGTAVYGGVSSSRASKKAQKANNALLSSSKNAFKPLAIPKPQQLHVPSAPSILSSWRGEVTGKFGEYDAIADRLNASEQDAARYANMAANPQYYQVLGQLTNNALQASRGVIPKDTQQNMLRQANEDAYLRGFSYGTPEGQSRTYAGGNEAAANLALRNLGLTSLDMQKYGDQLGGQVMDQSRLSRGTVMSAKDVVPTSDIFSNQMNASAVANYNDRQDKAGYNAAKINAPIQASDNKLALQMGIAQQNNAISAQASSNNAQLAMSAMQALGGLYGGAGTGASTIGAGRSVGNAAAASYTTGRAAGVNDASMLNTSLNTAGLNFNQPVASASTIRAIS